MIEKQQHWMLVGAPGSGKGTQGQRLAEDFGVKILATGDLLRAAIRSKSEFGKEIQQVMESGGYVSDAIMVQLVQEWVQARANVGYLLDGFPRTVHQLNEMLEAGIHISHVIHIQVPDDLLVERLSGRLIHMPSGRIYHRTFNAPRSDGLDNITGEALQSRADDREEIVHKRIEIFHKNTDPMLEALAERAQQGHFVLECIDGTGTVDAIHDRILQVLNN